MSVLPKPIVNSLIKISIFIHLSLPPQKIRHWYCLKPKAFLITHTIWGKFKVVPIHTMKSHIRNGSITLLILNFRTRWSLLLSFTRRSLYLRGETPLPTEKKAAWTPGSVCALKRRKILLSCRGTYPGPSTCIMVTITENANPAATFKDGVISYNRAELLPVCVL